jgi:chromosome segregation ATPase
MIDISIIIFIIPVRIIIFFLIILYDYAYCFERLVEVADQLAEAKTALEQKNKLIEQHKLTIAELQEHQYRPGEREFLNGKLLRRKAQVKELKELCAATARELSQRSAAEAKAAADLAELTAKHLQVRQTLENTMANLRDTKSAEDALEMKLMEAKQNHGQLSVMYGQMASTLKSQSQQIKEKNTIVSNLTLAHDKLESEHKDFSVSMLEIMNQNQTLVSQNAALVAENNTLSWRHKMLSANFKSLKEQHRRVFQEHDLATKQLHSVNKSLVNKTKMHSKAVSELSETKRKLQTSVEELEAVATKLTDSAQVQAALEARQSELTAQVTALTAEHTNALAQVTDLKALYSQAAELLEQAQRERVASDEGAAEAKRQRKSLAAVLSQTQTQLDEEKTKTELAHAALAELKSSHDLMQAALSDLTAQHDGACHHKRELERVTRELAENATQLKDSTDLLGLLAEEKLRLETAQADLHGVVGLQTTQLASARQAREALESQMKGLSERHSKAKQELRLAKRHVEQVASDAEQAGLVVDGLQRELSEKQTQLEKLEAQNQSLQAALDDVRQKYEVMSRQHGELTAQFHHESKLFEETKSEHDKLASHSETLANQLVECKRETAELRTELKAAENQLKSLGMQAGVSSTSKVNGALTKSHSPSVQRALTVAGNGSKPLADRGTAKLHTGSPANLGKDGVKDLTRRASPSNRAGSPKVTFKLLSKDGNSPENPEAAAEEIDTNNSNAAVAIAEGLLMVPISPATNYLLKDTSRTNIIQKSTKQAGRSEPVNKAPSSSGGKVISLKAREPREHAGNSKPGSNSSASHARALEAKVAALTQQLADAQATIAQLEIRVQRERQSFEALTMVHDMTTDTLKQTEAALEESKLQKSRLETELRELRLSLRGSTGKSGGVRGSAKR